MSTGISTNGQFLRLQAQTVRLQTRETDLQFQASSGMKGPSIGDLGTQARPSLNVRAVIDQLKSFKDNIARVQTDASVIDTAMNRMSDMMNDLRKAYTNLSTDLQANTTYINQIGKQGLKELGDLLNTQVDGRYVFAANDMQTTPVVNTDMLRTYAQIQMNNVVTGTTGAASTAIYNLQANLGLPAQAYAPAQYATFSQSLQYAGPPVKARVDVNHDVSYGIRADAPVFQDMLRAFATAATVQYAPNNVTEYKAVVANGLQTTISAIPTLNDEIAKLGMARADLTSMDKKHDDFIATLTIARGNMEDADMADVFAKLQQNDVAMQATYKIIGSMKNISLVNFLA